MIKASHLERAQDKILLRTVQGHPLADEDLLAVLSMLGSAPDRTTAAHALTAAIAAKDLPLFTDQPGTTTTYELQIVKALYPTAKSYVKFQSKGEK